MNKPAIEGSNLDGINSNVNNRNALKKDGNDLTKKDCKLKFDSSKEGTHSTHCDSPHTIYGVNSVSKALAISICLVISLLIVIVFLLNVRGSLLLFCNMDSDGEHLIVESSQHLPSCTNSKKDEHSIEFMRKGTEINSMKQKFCFVASDVLSIASKVTILRFVSPTFILPLPHVVKPKHHISSEHLAPSSSSLSIIKDETCPCVQDGSCTHAKNSNPLKKVLKRTISLWKNLKERRNGTKKKLKTKEKRFRTKELSHPKPAKDKIPEKGIDSMWYADASSSLEISLSMGQKTIINTLRSNFKDWFSKEMKRELSNLSFEKQMKSVARRGKSNKPRDWWYPPLESSRTNIGVKDGELLLFNYLKVMQWPKDHKTRFPAKLCVKGCNTDDALAHTFKWRRNYKPWLLTQEAFRQNEKGIMYFRGYSPTPFHVDNEKGGFGLLWFRPGLKKTGSIEGYFRIIINSIDNCVADTLSRTSTIGKCNMVLDCDGFGISMMPAIKQVKRLLTMLQDHYPNSLGVLVIANLSGASQVFLKMVMPFLPSIVKKKIHVLPSDADERMDMLTKLVDEKFIPDWLGGNDNYHFNAANFYKDTLYATNTEGIEYIKTMPYHA